ncbi:MAG: hypothetical protein M1347_08570 [Chloroflexi bacterium]|nr:hypothetical protein [Chloroflexota bacterium]
MITSLYTWLKYIHVLAGFMFLLGHGASVFVAYELKKTKDLERMKTLMDVSAAGWPAMMLSLLVLLLAGIITGFMGGWWGALWIWVSLVLLAAITGWMFSLGGKVYHPLRKMLGMEYMIQGKPQTVDKQRPQKEILDFVAATHPHTMTLIGLGGYALMIWLMIFKPF